VHARDVNEGHGRFSAVFDDTLEFVWPAGSQKQVGTDPRLTRGHVSPPTTPRRLRAARRLTTMPPVLAARHAVAPSLARGLGARRGRASAGPRVARAASTDAAIDANADRKVVVITGANTGLGKISATEISRDPSYRVVMACRDRARGDKAADDVAAATGNRPDVMLLDLASLRSVEDFARRFEDTYGRCDRLMNNAGVMALPKRTVTVDGLETQMGVNHFGHFHLTNLMMPAILAAPGRKRIVNLSSVAHEFGHPDFDNYNSTGALGYVGSGWLTYGKTKLANLYFTYELHRRLRNGGVLDVDVNAVHPGIVDTDLPRSLALNFYPLLRRTGGLITPAQGATGQIDACVGETWEGVSGKYVAEQSGPRGSEVGPGGKKGVFKVTESSRYSYDQEAAARLWKVSKALTGAGWEAIGEGKVEKASVAVSSWM